MILNEGGNVFADATPFDHKDVPNILQSINAALQGTGIRAIPVGSAATPKAGKKSGDMDVIVDEPAVLNFFKSKDAKTARKALNDYISKQGLQTAQSGINVHVRVPLGDEAHQVDIMVTPNAERVAKFHTHDIPDSSPYKGVNKQLMLAILAKSKGYMWSAWQGLFSRNPDGKKGEFVTDDLDEIADILTGAKNSKVLGSVESILAALPSDQAQALLARAKEDPNWKEQPVSEDVARLLKLSGLSKINETTQMPPMPDVTGLQPGQIKQLDGGQVEIGKDGNIIYTSGFGKVVYNPQGKPLSYQSASFAGLGMKQDLGTGDTTTSYNAGPISLSQTKNAKGQTTGTTGSYNTGAGKINYDQAYRDGKPTVQTRTGTGDHANTAFVKNQDVYDKARKSLPANEELDAMLRIARLR